MASKRAGREENKVLREAERTEQFLRPPHPHTGSPPWLSRHIKKKEVQFSRCIQQPKTPRQPLTANSPFLITQIPPHPAPPPFLGSHQHFLCLLCTNIWPCREQDGPGPGRGKEERRPKGGRSRSPATLLSVQSRHRCVRDRDSPVGSRAARITVASRWVSHTTSERGHLPARSPLQEGGMEGGREGKRRCRGDEALSDCSLTRSK